LLYWLSQYLQQYYTGFSVLQYLTLRAMLAALISLGLVLIFGAPVIKWLTKAQIGQVVRDNGPKSHLNKAGTPTMGGILIIAAMTIATIICSKPGNIYIITALVAACGFGAIGWIDDYRKLIKKDSSGLSAKGKLILQSILGFGLAITFYSVAKTPAETALLIPFFKNLIIPLGAAYIILAYFVIVGTSNAVNLTDGLDGLAILPTVIIAAALGVFAYILGNINFAEYLHFPYISGVEELTIFCSSLVGAGLGFLWFNTYPAQIFMGDVGALGLGAALGTVAIALRQELVLFIMGGVFVVETISVMLQVGYFKLYRKRLFRMAPIHHHFELAGWPEPKVIVRFWIITVVLVIVGLATIKIR